MKTSAFVIAFLLAVLILPAVAQQTAYHIEGDGWFGCTTEELFDEISGYLAATDKEAYEDAMMEGLLTGDCTLFEDGETVYLENTSIWSGMIQVKRPGETLKYWTSMEAAKNDAAEANAEELGRTGHTVSSANSAGGQSLQNEHLNTSGALRLSNMNTMQLYENAQNGFKMSYPTNWISQEPDANDQGIVVGFLAPGEDVNNPTVYLLVQIEKLPSGQKTTLEQYGQAVQRYLRAAMPDLAISTEGDISIDGQPGHAIVYNLTSEDVTYRVFKAWTLHGENAYGFTYSAPDDRYDLFAEDISKMIDSLKFDTATALYPENLQFQNGKTLAQDTRKDTNHESIGLQTEDLTYNGYITFSNNRGESIDDAISIHNAKTDKEGVDSEYYYLEWRFGEKNVDWKLDQQYLLHEGERVYDEMDIILSDGRKPTIYFDITDFFGKL